MDTAAPNGPTGHWVLAAAGVDLLGSRVARRYGLVGEPFLIRQPRFVPVPLTSLVWGTALSGPLLVDAALLVLGPAVADGNARAARVVRLCGVLRLVGVLAEPVTWGRRLPRWATLVGAAHIIIAIGLIQGPSKARQ